ncbi:hypothetical protein [Nocardioides campestrisoli]|uniref:hypothetical protein n=1 Tax=Nocardioides campestrisoli TaxID=2736757 RepID=UPI0015E66DFD|nr:hypothetical protein [Nocardioides campestrisoli]
MGGTLNVNWPNATTLLQSMVDVGMQAGEIDTYFNEHVVVTTGLDYPSCALKPIGDQLPALGEAFTWTRNRYQKRWVKVIESFAVSMRDVERTDGELSIDFGQYLGGLGNMPQIPDLYLNVEFLDVKSLEEKLTPPGEGGPTMKHDAKWETAASGYDATRDAINEAIGHINSLGVNLPKLPEKSLEEYIIYPLAGNYAQLQGNAEACGHCSGAFTEWAGNFGRLALKAPAAIEGQTGVAVAGHLGLYGTVMLAVGQAVKQGENVFDAIAKMSEKIAVQVEKALVKLTTKLTKLLSKLSSKLSPLGWIWFAAEVLEKGWQAVTDIYDDIMDCKEIIQACFGLAEEIEAWAQVMAESLEEMRKMKEMVEQLPRADSDGGLPALPPIDLPKVEKELGGITYTFDDEPSEEEDELRDRLDKLGGETDTDDPFEDVPEDAVILAPGPLGVPSTSTPTTVNL